MLYADFLASFGQIQGIYEQMAAKTQGKQGRGFVGRESPSFMTPFIESSISNSEHKGPH